MLAPLDPVIPTASLRMTSQCELWGGTLGVQLSVPSCFHLRHCCQLTGTWGEGPGAGYGFWWHVKRWVAQGSLCSLAGLGLRFPGEDPADPCCVTPGTHWSPLDLSLFRGPART